MQGRRHVSIVTKITNCPIEMHRVTTLMLRRIEEHVEIRRELMVLPDKAAEEIRMVEVDLMIIGPLVGN